MEEKESQYLDATDLYASEIRAEPWTWSEPERNWRSTLHDSLYAVIGTTAFLAVLSGGALVEAGIHDHNATQRDKSKTEFVMPAPTTKTVPPTRP